MSGKIRLSKSSISQAEKDAVLKVLDKEYLGMGEEVKLFEEKIKNYLETSPKQSQTQKNPKLAIGDGFGIMKQRGLQFMVNF